MTIACVAISRVTSAVLLTQDRDEWLSMREKRERQSDSRSKSSERHGSARRAAHDLRIISSSFGLCFKTRRTTACIHSTKDRQESATHRTTTTPPPLLPPPHDAHLFDEIRIQERTVSRTLISGTEAGLVPSRCLTSALLSPLHVSAQAVLSSAPDQQTGGQSFRSPASGSDTTTPAAGSGDPLFDR